MSTVKERPILFSGAMVRALLSGQKTVTRRPITPQPIVQPIDSDIPIPMLTFRGRHGGHWIYPNAIEHIIAECPLGQAGERLWVRETWSDVNAYGAHSIIYRADDHIRRLDEEDDFLGENGCFNLPDPRIENLYFSTWFEDLLAGTEGRWRPSIHMPRWASRITLEITDVRVERLQAITEDQAIAEGAQAEPCDHIRQSCADVGCWGDTARGAFGFLWESIYGAGSWAANPWVWVVQFRRIES